MINVQKMMQQAQMVQQKLQEMQEKFRDLYVTGESGGGLVKVTMNCVGDVQNIAIDPSVIDPSDRETLEDLIVAAMNNAADAKETRIQSETAAMMQELGLPEGTDLPF
jgi:DNA-binding YbaB/EbfC family protein